MPREPVGRFPGFGRCMAIIRNHKDAMAQEGGYYWLLPRVGEFVELLLAELEAESDPHTQGWILELLGEARDVRTFPAFVRQLFSPAESVRVWAESGLRGLGQTREGRKVLWAAYRQQDGLLGLSDDCDEQHVHEVLARILHAAHSL